MTQDIDNILKDIKSEKVKLHKLETVIDKDTATKIRRRFVEEKIQCDLSDIANFAFDPERIYSRNCENLIEGVSLPVGIAGPIKVLGTSANGEYFVPIATTEGALVASVNRGAKLISISGGARTISTYVGITRAPLYRVNSILQAKEFKSWVSDQKLTITQIVKETDPYISLIDYEVYTNGKNIWVRFKFNTLDAMGMNMAVVACKKISEWMEEKFKGLKTVSISGNLCVDKKPAVMNIIEGRGRIVESEVLIPKKIIEEELKTTVEEIVEVNRNKVWVGGHMSGSLGFNAHVANVVAGVYIATGQDPAQVVGGSLASTTMEIESGDLYAHIRIPEVNVATVGGGTGLPSQKAIQKIMLANVSSQLEEKSKINQTDKLAEILGAACLAGEISLIASFANRGFVKAHQDYGRSSK